VKSHGTIQTKNKNLPKQNKKKKNTSKTNHKNTRSNTKPKRNRHRRTKNKTKNTPTNNKQTTNQNNTKTKTKHKNNTQILPLVRRTTNNKNSNKNNSIKANLRQTNPTKTSKKLYDLLKNKLKIPSRKAKLYIEWLKKPITHPTVKSLLQFCKYLKINPKQLEEKGLFTRKFPINLKTPTLIKLKTHILNEGKITITKTTKQLQANYVNKDPTLHKYVIELLKELEANVKEKPRWDQSKGAYVTNIDPTIARALIKTGLKPGKKTITNPTLDPEIYKNLQLRKYHFQATLTEEGTSSIYITKEKRLKMTIAWDRSIDITDKLTPQQIQKLKQLITEKKRKIPIGKIKSKRYFDILSIIVDNPPKLLVDEMKILNKVHSKTFKIRPQKIHVSKDEHISVAWNIIFFDIKSLSLFYFEYGMLDNTWKSMRLKKQFELFRKYGRRKLSDEEINEIQEYLNQIPRRITNNWIKSATKKLFRET